MKETDAIIIMRNYLWTHKIEMSHKEREALQRIIDALVLYRTEARGNCNQVATNLQLTCNVLISRADAIDAVRKKLQDWGSYADEDYRRGLYAAQDILEALPSADAEDVVRCKDCRYRELDGDVTHYYWCRINERPVDDTDYCAWGMESEVEE